jgi:large subunit ribosomal protein L10
MALSKDQKAAVVAEVANLLTKSKMTVVASYKGINVKSLQSLRKSAKANGTVIRIIKNRLFMQALKNVEKLKDTDTDPLKEQLLYAFNDEDEVLSAQILANFAKNAPSLWFVGGIAADGNFISADDIKALANLPAKDQLRAQLAGTIAAPLSGFVNTLSANIRGVLCVLQARADSL